MSGAGLGWAGGGRLGGATGKAPFVFAFVKGQPHRAFKCPSRPPPPTCHSEQRRPCEPRCGHREVAHGAATLLQLLRGRHRGGGLAQLGGAGARAGARAGVRKWGQPTGGGRGKGRG